MDKIIGLGNALVDVLANLKDDTLLDEMGLPKGSMQLIDDAKSVSYTHLDVYKRQNHAISERINIFENKDLI